MERLQSARSWKTMFGNLSFFGESFEPKPIPDNRKMMSISAAVVALMTDSGFCNRFNWNRVRGLFNGVGSGFLDCYSFAIAVTEGKYPPQVSEALVELGDRNLFCSVLAVMECEGYFGSGE